MRPERTLVAERALARHSPLLLGRGAPATASPSPAAQRAPRLGLAVERLTRTLAEGLARLTGAGAPAVTAAPPETLTMAELAAGIAPFAANSLLGVGDDAAPFIASIEADAILRLVDRAYGGRGLAHGLPVRAFPVSAQLLIERLETALGAAIAAAFAPARAEPPTIRAVARDSALAQIAPFAADEPLTRIVLTVGASDGQGWTVTLGLSAPTLALLLGDPARGATPRPRSGAAATDGSAAPFAEMPLTLRVVLADLRLPYARLAALAVGDVLPVAVARSVPVSIGHRTIAHGTVGALDDRVAVQLTHAFTTVRSVLLP